MSLNPSRGGGTSLRFESSALDLPKDLASVGRSPPPPVGLGSASTERASPQDQIVEDQSASALPAPSMARRASRSEKHPHPVITQDIPLQRSQKPIFSLARGAVPRQGPAIRYPRKTSIPWARCVRSGTLVCARAVH